jgi:hypothetical protein
MYYTTTEDKKINSPLPTPTKSNLDTDNEEKETGGVKRKESPIIIELLFYSEIDFMSFSFLVHFLALQTFCTLSHPL